MKREIKFKGVRVDGKGWAYGIYIEMFNRCYILSPKLGGGIDQHHVIPKSIGQLTGLQDIDGKEIYEGDIVEYHYLKNYVQQSHWDIPPEIDSYTINKQALPVVFKNGMFTIEDDSCPDGYETTIAEIGLSKEISIQELLDLVGAVDDENTDMNGNVVDESIYGVRVIGNIHEQK